MMQQKSLSPTPLTFNISQFSISLQTIEYFQKFHFLQKKREWDNAIILKYFIDEVFITTERTTSNEND